MTKGRSIRRILIVITIGCVVAGLIGLGVWQLQRRVWKLDLIQRTEAMLRSPPVPAPPPAAWAAIAKDDAYRPVIATGRYRPDADTYTQAATALGGGFWVLTPLDTGRFTLLVNRGFVTPERRGKVAAPTGTVTVRGLLRITEPDGGFLRSNMPSEDRWYSRDVAAIAEKRGLTNVAPYFIDAVADRQVEWPRGGLTVVTFRNNHLVYALTWFGLALLLAGMTWWVARREPRA
ncbi:MULTISPECIES: SURF1 family protein [unclassified Sphingomonas]|uniref:SURF1 family protein n=1 Tax=unclassified Sphingomonas TaxID=196159 RepID=UPI0006F9DD2E|nr:MULTISPECIES: SURF1 family protein [unclassified Sphingomonas]KQM59910.1 Surfeit locus 1 family protein [Sphingomonas sp. Leaf16]KQN11308.1 Surfeit locus 1 family protein [Sphingomonas sp. Leaf29]KQN18630.1 Surfeit locus 1 family protein [Sphingomonas sp. Leaf32]